MKRHMHVYTLLFFILIVTMSFTWKGIMKMYEASYNHSSTETVQKMYSILNGKYQFELPQNWKFTRGITSGGEVLYSGDFVSNDKKITGLVQAWNIGTPLKEFLEKSKFSSVGMVDIKDYNLKPYQTGIHRGYILTYSSTGSDGQVYRSTEYFIPANDKEFFRISFFVKEQNFTEELKKVFDSIASTLKIRK